MRFEEKYLDVLQNIESTIVRVYRQNPALLDYDVMSALEALIRHYKAEASGRTAREARLDERPQQVRQALQEICDFRLGRPNEELKQLLPLVTPISLAEVVDCLKRIETSVRRWNKQGRRGYLDFIVEYIK